MEALSGRGVGGRRVGVEEGVLVGVAVSGGSVAVGEDVGLGSTVLVGVCCS